MRFRQDENGQMLVLTALSLVALLGFMALAIDVGVLFRARRNMQIAADSAAMAGALDYLYNGSTSSAATAAANAAAANGVTTNYTVTANTACPSTSQNCVVVTIPASGPTGTEPFAVGAGVSMPNPVFFMRMFGASNVIVGAHAVAASPTVGTACIWAMAPHGNGLKLQGSYNIQAPSCGVYVNSSDSDAIDVIGNGGTVNAKYVDVVGGNSGNHTTSPTGETLYSPPMTTPWGNLTGPNPSTAGTCDATNTISTTTVTQAQITTVVGTPAAGGTTTGGTMTNGIVCLTGTNATITATTLPGWSSGITYLFTGTGNLTIGNTMTFGSGTWNAGTQTFTNTAGATLDIYRGTFNQNNSTLSIYATASASSTMDGIAIFQPPTNANELQAQFGSGNEVLDGYIYAPGAEVFMQDSGGGIVATGIVANYIYEKTTALDIVESYDAANPNTTLNRVVSLVE